MSRKASSTPSPKPKPAPDPDPGGSILTALTAAGTRGATKTALVGSPARKGFSPALTRLLKAGAVVNLGDAKAPRYVLPEHDRRADEARAAIERLAVPGQAVAFTKAALRCGRRGAAAKIADEAAARLVTERRLIPVRAGRSTLFLHAAALLPLLSLPTASPAALPPTETRPSEDVTTFSPDAVRTAYTALSRERGLSDVPIRDLQQRSGAPLPELQAWLREESRAGRAVPSRGDWALVGEAERAAAIEIRGEPHLRVRLLNANDQ